jgi:death on curing protein
LQSRFLTKRLLLSIHRDQIQSFGGEPGVRDEGLLESALEQPRATFGGKLLHKTVAEQAAAYLFHLANNHPFVDGNKRVAFAAADTFLRLNGFDLKLPDRDAYKLVMGVASSEITKDELVSRIRAAIEAAASPD